MKSRRTDLAVEAREIWQESTEKTTELEGVSAREKDIDGVRVETVCVLDERGEKELGKPKGTYVTVNLERAYARSKEDFNRSAQAVASSVRELMPLKEKDTVLVAGLGNNAITPDRVGPLTMKHTLATRHLADTLPEYFGSMRRVSVMETGVLGTTGLESAEMLRAVCAEVKPDAVIVVDALASRKAARVCSTVQLTDTGIVPGSGVGNSRAAINSNVLGVPVVAVGVPTVVDAATLAADLMEAGGIKSPSPDAFGETGGMIVTPRDIDAMTDDVSHLLGMAINLALFDGMNIEDIEALTM
ncbi:MAG: GPR endopeptidase [Clostridiales bacterium]|nr:GPR endopeptidase [Clostridiales bacterium]